MLITLARKPLPKGVNVATNALQYGCGGINIDATRIAGVLPTPCFGTGWSWHDKNNALLGYRDKEYYADQAGAAYTPSQLGRWPANVLHDGSEAVLAGFPQAGGGFGQRGGRLQATVGDYGLKATMQTVGFGDSGSAARFFKQIEVKK